MSAVTTLGTLPRVRLLVPRYAGENRRTQEIIRDRGRIVRALLSVWNKTGIVTLARHLHDLGWDLVSTGQTHHLIAAEGIPVRTVSDVTGVPEMMGGRVKTLHPAIHGGILARRDHPGDVEALVTHDIAPFDMVVANLYPFVATIAEAPLPPPRVADDLNAAVADAIEQIDIGGPAMIRAGAKSFADVLVVTDPDTYPEIVAALTNGTVDLLMRARLAHRAYAHTAAYDASIAAYFAAMVGEEFPDVVTLPLVRERTLSYGENPHQQGALYRLADPRLMGPGLADLVQLSGDEPSYNNLLDLDCARAIVSEFVVPAVAIVKHNNPCGVGIGETVDEAYHRAFAGDPLSAFGGVVAANRMVDEAMARSMSGILFWVLVAPGFTDEALRIFARRQTRVFRLATPTSTLTPSLPTFARQYRPVSGGFLSQTPDTYAADDITFTPGSARRLSDPEIRDLRMAWRVVKHVRSNASVFVRNGAVRAVGAGQMSRLDSVLSAERIAARTAVSHPDPSLEGSNRALAGSVMATDGFFADPDAVEAAAQAGATAIAHPGGGRKDAQAGAMADRYGIALVTTGVRHFRH